MSAIEDSIANVDFFLPIDTSHNYFSKPNFNLHYRSGLVFLCRAYCNYFIQEEPIFVVDRSYPILGASS